MSGIADLLRKFEKFVKNFDSNTTRNGTTCWGRKLNADMTHTIACVPGLLILLILGFFVRRRRLFPSCCGGRPGLIVPMTGLETRHERTAFLLAFGSLVGVVLRVFDESAVPFYEPRDPDWMKTLKQILAVFLYGTVWYPLFAAISAEMLLGYVLGLLYGLPLFAININNIIVCVNLDEDGSDTGVFLMRYIPANIFLLLLCCYFVLRAVRLLQGWEVPSRIAEFRERVAMNSYVARLLGRHKRQQSDRKLEAIREKLQDLRFLSKTGFLFPPRLLCSLLVAAFVIYTFTLEVYVLTFRGFRYARSLALYGLVGSDDRSFDQVVASLRSCFSINGSCHEIDKDVGRVVEYTLMVIEQCIAMALTVAALISFSHFPFICIFYRRNVLLAYKGQYPLVRPPSEMTGKNVLLGLSRLAGYQTAYLMWGFLLQFLILTIINLLLAFLLIIPLKFEFGGFWLTLLQNKWPLPLLALSVVFAENVVTQTFFIQERGDKVALNNRKAFFVWTYYLFFYNVFLGFVSCLFRILKSIAVGILLVGRVDLTVLPRIFEALDPGFNVYRGFVLAEVAHNNPVMRTFLSILWTEVQTVELEEQHSIEVLGDEAGSRPASEGDDEPRRSVREEKQHHRRLQRRWQLLYTLLRNDELRALRRQDPACGSETASTVSSDLDV